MTDLLQGQMSNILYGTFDSSITKSPTPAFHGTQKAPSEDERSQFFIQEDIPSQIINQEDSIQPGAVEVFYTPNHSFHNLYSSSSESEQKLDIENSYTGSSAMSASPLMLEAELLLNRENPTNLKRGTAIRVDNNNNNNNNNNNMNDEEHDDDNISMSSSKKQVVEQLLLQGPISVPMNDGVHVTRLIDKTKIVIGKCEPNNPLHQNIPSWSRGFFNDGNQELVTRLPFETCPEPWQEPLDSLAKTALSNAEKYRRRTDPWDLARIDVLNVPRNVLIDDEAEDGRSDEPRFSLKWTGPKPTTVHPSDDEKKPINLMNLGTRQYPRPRDEPIVPDTFKARLAIETTNYFLGREAYSDPSAAQETNSENNNNGPPPAHASLPPRFLSKAAISDITTQNFGEMFPSLTSEIVLRPRIQDFKSIQPIIEPSLDELMKDRMSSSNCVFWRGTQHMSIPLVWELGEFFTPPPIPALFENLIVREYHAIRTRVNPSQVNEDVTRDIKITTAPLSEIQSKSSATVQTAPDKNVLDVPRDVLDTISNLTMFINSPKSTTHPISQSLPISSVLPVPVSAPVSASAIAPVPVSVSVSVSAPVSAPVSASALAPVLVVAPILLSSKPVQRQPVSLNPHISSRFDIAKKPPVQPLHSRRRDNVVELKHRLTPAPLPKFLVSTHPASPVQLIAPGLPFPPPPPPPPPPPSAPLVPSLPFRSSPLAHVHNDPNSSQSTIIEEDLIDEGDDFDLVPLPKLSSEIVLSLPNSAFRMESKTKTPPEEHEYRRNTESLPPEKNDISTSGSEPYKSSFALSQEDNASASKSCGPTLRDISISISGGEEEKEEEEKEEEEKEKGEKDDDDSQPYRFQAKRFRSVSINEDNLLDSDESIQGTDLTSQPIAVNVQHTVSSSKATRPVLTLVTSSYLTRARAPQLIDSISPTTKNGIISPIKKVLNNADKDYDEGPIDRSKQSGSKGFSKKQSSNLMFTVSSNKKIRRFSNPLKDDSVIVQAIKVVTADVPILERQTRAKIPAVWAKKSDKSRNEDDDVFEFK